MRQRTSHRTTDIAVADIMTREVITTTPDISVETLMAVLLDRHISGVPVVDTAGRPIGMVTKTDLVRDRYERPDDREPVRLAKVDGHEVDLGPGYHTEVLASALVGEVMAPVAFTLTETAPVSRAAALMAYEGVHRLPVVNAAGVVVGILDPTIDVLRWIAEERGYALPEKTVPQARRVP